MVFIPRLSLSQGKESAEKSDHEQGSRKGQPKSCSANEECDNSSHGRRERGQEGSNIPRAKCGHVLKKLGYKISKTL